jgi:hypothetical protein
MNLGKISCAIVIVTAFAMASLSAVPVMADHRGDTADLWSLEASVGTKIKVGSNIELLGEAAPDRQVVETSIAVDPRNPNVIAAGAGDLRLKEGGDWEGYYRSTDGGATWTSRLIPGFPGDSSAEGLASPLNRFDGCIDPSLAFDRQGNLYFSGTCSKITAEGAPDFGTFGVFVAKFSDDGAAYVGATVVDSGALNPDFPKIAVDTTGGSNDGNVYVEFTHDTDGQTLFSRSTDGGRSFSQPLAVLSPGINFNVAIDPDGNIYFATADVSNGNVYVTAAHCAGGDGRHGCKRQASDHADGSAAKSAEGGLSFSSPVVAATITPIPTSFPGNNLGVASPTVTIAADEHGVYLVMDDYSTGSSNVLFTRSTDGGSNWTRPIQVNDVAQGQHFYPTIAVSRGILSVAWYDSRLGQLPSGTITSLDTFYAESRDGGSSFSKNVRVSDVSFDPNQVLFPLFVPLCQCAFVGDYIGIAAGPDAVHVIWTDNRNACDTVDPTWGCVDQDAITATVAHDG